LSILEEAHTLVPENIGTGGRYGNSQVVIEKISQIALQGRKYNVGFLLISQRTATVKKTVLNQCNTMISFRAYDETSFNFLTSYFGEEYVKEIAHLKNDGDSRYVIAAGKAVVADRPIIVEVKEN
jgi:DNA helicase HerA-like ATPase